MINASKMLSWTRGPFDHVIVGHALKKIPLITRDRTIQKNYEQVIY